MQATIATPTNCAKKIMNNICQPNEIKSRGLIIQYTTLQ